MPDILSLAFLACLWLAYFLLHSWLASLGTKHWVARQHPAFTPWYCLIFNGLAITLYFLIGSMLEEKKLLVYHGEEYRKYRKLVPGLIPRPWRYLSREQALSLSDQE